jgi:hypothetical protein
MLDWLLEGSITTGPRAIVVRKVVGNGFDQRPDQQLVPTGPVEVAA